MTMRRYARIALVAVGMLLVGGCAGLQRADSLNVFVAGVEPLKGEGLEVRMLVKLRVQNPNDVPLDYNGASLQMDVQGKRFATGVSSAAGSIPRFGEAIIGVPVSVSVLGILRQAVGVVASDFRGKLAYEMTGQFAGPGFGSLPFRSAGEVTLPAEIFGDGK